MPGASHSSRTTRRPARRRTPEYASSLNEGHALRRAQREDLPVALWSIRATSIDPSEQLVDDFRRDPFVVGVRAGYVPPSHGTVESDQPRDTIPPKIPRPEVARVVHGPRVVCSSAVRS
jgi:hypothetical protein